MSSPNGTAVRQRFRPPSKSSTATPRPRPRQPSKAPFQLHPLTAFYILLASHTLAALYHPIQDCDEVFNYYEPTHYLLHGHGFQTWEYSPDYAIRSWAYTGLHALILLPFKLFAASKTTEFYGLRVFLGAVCAGCEARLFAKVAATFNARIAIFLLAILATSPGMAHAAISYLPSTFAMYAATLGSAAFLDWRGGLRTAQAIWLFGTGAVLGWPFVGALIAPFVAEGLFLASLSDREGVMDTAWRFVYGMTRTALTLLAQACVDWFFYKKLVLVPLNIVLYNVFSSHGPNIYGTEPWHFYLRNLFLNFHVFFPLALLSMPLLLAQHFSRAKGATKASYLRGIVFLTPFYLWLAIFTLQPHKEERFMYPAYPFLALNAAIALHILLANLGSTDPKDLVSRIPVQLRFAGILAFVGAALAVSVLRTLGTVTAYGAPLSIYQPLHALAPTTEATVCLGKEWYRFPSHLLLPAGTKAKFLKTEFDGLLPGEFSEIPGGQGFGMFPGAWLVPTGMNDGNREDLGKYTEMQYCDYLVDSHLPSTVTAALEPAYVHDEKDWERIKCMPFLDAQSTGLLGRILWVPDLPFIPQRFRRVWGEYCLLKRKAPQPAVAAAEIKGRAVRVGDGVPGIEHLA
ncbi:mannosyltransferase [Teratosphaeriaceae sp. CCFEE 6253]|nr:mannosyltransferase [Teratosphaeriaceae sp. CCFEE 6253]